MPQTQPRDAQGRDTLSALVARAPKITKSGELPITAIPRAQYVHLDLDPTRPNYSGHTRIDLVTERSVHHVVLHAEGLTLGNVQLGDRQPDDVTLRKSVEAVRPDELVLTFLRPIPPGRHQLIVSFQGTYGSDLLSLYRAQVNHDWFILSQFQGTYARRAFPCFDEPRHKIPYTLSVRAPAKSMVVSNELVESEKVDADAATKTVLFAPTKPLPSYLVALAIGPFRITPGPSLGPGRPQVRALTTGEDHLWVEYALAQAPRMVERLETFFDQPYPYSKLDVLAAPEFAFGAMENPGLIVFRREALLLKQPGASWRARSAVAATLAHELAHQWFGNLVTPAWWSDLWLNEGFATFMAPRVVADSDPVLLAHDEIDEGMLPVMDADDEPGSLPVRDKDNSPVIRYGKGAAVLTSIERWLGALPFRHAVSGYIKAHAHGLVSFDDFLGALTPLAPDIRRVASPWLDARGVPTLRTCNANEERAAPWRLPVCTNERCDLRPTLQGSRLDPLKICGQVNDNPRGLYLRGPSDAIFSAKPQSKYDTARWLSWFFAAFETADPERRLETSAEAHDDTAPSDLSFAAAIRALRVALVERRTATLARLATIVPTLYENAPATLRMGVRSVVREGLSPLLQEVKLDDPSPSLDAVRRQEAIIGLLVATENADRLADATGTLETRVDRLLSGTLGFIDLDNIVLRNGLRNGSTQQCAKLRATLARGDLPERRQFFVGALGAFARPQAAEQCLGALLTSATKVQDTRYILREALSFAAGRRNLRSWVMTNWDKLLERFPGSLRTGFLDVVGATCDSTELAEDRAFFLPRVEGDAEAIRRIEVRTVASRRCVEQREMLRRRENVATR
jgi:alanyl aminopeptidase